MPDAIPLTGREVPLRARRRQRDSSRTNPLPPLGRKWVGVVSLDSYDQRVTANTTQVILVTLGSGVASGVVVTLVQEYFGRRAREAEVEESRRVRAAEVQEQRRHDSARIVGPALACLRDLEPESNIGALNGNARMEEAMSEKWATWLRASGELEVLGATHPDTDVDRLCQSIITNGDKLMNRIHFGVRDGAAPSDAWWTETKAFHQDATTEGRGLVRAVLEQPI